MRFLKILIIFGFCCLSEFAAGFSKDIHVLALFDPSSKNDQVETAFNATVKTLNIREVFKIWNIKKPNSKRHLISYNHNVGELDSYHARELICGITNTTGLAAIIGPQAAALLNIVRSTCHNLQIPNLVLHWDYSPMDSDYTLNYFPEAKLLAKAYADVVKLLGWKSFTILYETNDGLVRLQEVLKNHQSSEYPITVRQFNSAGDLRPLLKEIHNSGESHMVIDCEADSILSILSQADEVNMMDQYQSYFFTSLDAHIVNFSDLKYKGTNITMLRIIDPKNEIVNYALNDFNSNPHRRTFTAETLKVETALMYDALYHLVESVNDVAKGSPKNTVYKPVNCSFIITDANGGGLANYMRNKGMKGVTGDIRFNKLGQRIGFTLEILEYSKNGTYATGTWNPATGIDYTRTSGDTLKIITDEVKNKTFKVSSRIGAPYLSWKEPREGRTGNDRFEGYSIDLIDKICQHLECKYEFELVPDSKYGGYDPTTKSWNGLVKELLDRRADLALCDLTITHDREKAVDFTMPFMTLGISILYKKPQKAETNLFSFLSPLSVDIWIYMATAYLGVSALLFILSRISPQEWSNPHPCNQEPEELENKLSLSNSIWHNVGSLMQQGSDIAPQAVSTRMVASMWWFFTLIIIASYTANLAAFLTVTRMDASINNVEDLAKQTKIKYGVLAGGSSANFFRDSNYSTYQRMWAAMTAARPDVFVDSNDKGVERVKKGGYAYFMESTSIEYQIEQNCDLMQVGGLLDSKGYGIAMPVNSLYRTVVSGAVLYLQERGELEKLKKKWWKEMHKGVLCEDDGSASASSTELGMDNVGGVFVVLIFGCLSAFIVSILEFLWNCRSIAVEEMIPYWTAVKIELQFAMSCASTKPVRKKKGSTNSEENLGNSFAQLDNFEKIPIDPKH